MEHTPETLRLTPQRSAVLEVVRASDGHPTAGDVFDATRKLLPAISQATVYNSLRFLADAGLVREITFGNGASRYDRETTRHDHAICVQCATLVDFDVAPSAEVAREAAERSGFLLETIEMTLRGLCPACRIDAAR